MRMSAWATVRQPTSRIATAVSVINATANRIYAGTSEIERSTMRIQFAGSDQRKVHSQNSTAGSTDSPRTTLSTANAEKIAQPSRPSLSSVYMSQPYDPRVTIQGEGAPLVLVPGMDGTGQLFYRQVPLLSRRYRVATYALRDDTSDMDRLVADLAHVVDTVAPGEQRAVVIGESFGGALALSFALAMPQKVSALVVLNSFPFF